MARTVAIGIQDFEKIQEEHAFYVDKTDFIREWWENKDDVTLITRPRRFGKTLTMDMLQKFFSVGYKNRGELFEGLKIWKNEKYRDLQGQYPVICLSFANIKERDCESAKKRICQILTNLYIENDFIRESGILKEKEYDFFESVSVNMDEITATMALHQLSGYLYRYYGKKVIILLDEYDTPIQEAYVNGYWEEFTSFVRSMFHAAFKTNPYLERAIMTGITRISKESIFSDLNNLEVVTTTSAKYEESFGFTEEEVFAALEEYGLMDSKSEVKSWYDGFAFGSKTEIYNPWSIINYLDKKQLSPYWVNTSSNSLVGKLIRESGKTIKQEFESLMQGKTLRKEIDEQIVYNQLNRDAKALWSLLLASGYLKVGSFRRGFNEYGDWEEQYELELTNFEVKYMFRRMIKGWFETPDSSYNDFIKALLRGNLTEMNAYMNQVALDTFSYFDVGKALSWEAPERFYHGFVLGLMVELSGRYRITSNHESGFGRYDVMLEPAKTTDDAIIMEFKVHSAKEEDELSDTVKAALQQIEEKQYAAVLLAKGIPETRIQKYGFAFQGKKVFIGKA